MEKMTARDRDAIAETWTGAGAGIHRGAKDVAAIDD
jgi:hypothetical protein